MSIPLICITLLAILCLGLGFSVSLIRTKSNVLYSSNIDPEDGFYKLVRAHGNTTEYAPIIAILIFILSQTSQPVWVIGCMILVTFFRYLFVMGLLFARTMARSNPIRVIGALGTYLTGFGLCGALFLQALN